ncbi:MAG: AbrB/MazE/SpoVT family DNA-binding domain-containing protein [Pseudobutyrivibrio sp.]|uniref:AbrB/MazE/SpoVT family DNA-binding domain-containing protein n=1 Tax=Pseudobutyrivibrio sp. TaxID=2014367 RepID=UPI002600056E|nr:AbrB/MazE/SpoVT family DNA-binding domain-containing protein [Pseudobutyrivibrio sp.]MBQ8489750.1 AbrB/MazE/SpoVT family DNA-binding domain-containing protein [Pseudobutyrivibrio sp.]
MASKSFISNTKVMSKGQVTIPKNVRAGKIAPLKDTFEDLRYQLLGKPESFSFNKG